MCNNNYKKKSYKQLLNQILKAKKERKTILTFLTCKKNCTKLQNIKQLFIQAKKKYFLMLKKDKLHIKFKISITIFWINEKLRSMNIVL